MKTVTVNASRSYDILIGRGLLQTLPEQIQKLGQVETVLVISDSTVNSIHGHILAQIIKNADICVLILFLKSKIFTYNLVFYNINIVKVNDKLLTKIL